MKNSGRQPLIYRLLFLGLFFLGICLPVSAIPLSAYHRNLQNAINALDTLAVMDEEETPAYYQRRVEATATSVRNALPEKQTIESHQSTCTVDNSWLHKKLDEYEAATGPNRTFIRRQLIESLRSIEDRVADLEKATAVNGLSKAEANKKMADILARSEYESKGPQGAFIYRLLERFIKWLAKFLPQRSSLPTSHGSPFTAIAQIVVVTLAVAVIGFVLIKLISRLGQRSRKTKVKKNNEPRIVLGERLEPEASAIDLLTEAEALARQGEIRAAIRKTYIALLVELGDRKVISLAHHKTNRDYLRSVSNIPALHRNMSGLTDSFERHWYGFAESTSSDWQSFRDSYLAALQNTN